MSLVLLNSVAEMKFSTTLAICSPKSSRILFVSYSALYATVKA
jgi:hypothetical protein